MYARSTTFHGTPANVDAGLAYVETEVWPMLEKTAGCRGMSMLVDRGSGYCIATSAWDSEEAMHASDEAMGPVRERGRDILAGSMEVEEWEIALMHRTGHGACCRVSWLEGDLKELTETMRVGILPELETTPGFCGASVLVSPATGRGCVTTLWQDRAAMDASRAATDELRRRVAGAAGGTILEVHEFELALAHLHVPEMA